MFSDVMEFWDVTENISSISWENGFGGDVKIFLEVGHGTQCFRMLRKKWFWVSRKILKMLLEATESDVW